MMAPQLTSRQALELKQTFRLAYGKLSLHLVDDWLRTQPRGRVIATPRHAVGCLLATYLMHQTNVVWCVGESVFWPLQLGRDFARPLPTWATYCVSLEDQCSEPLTVNRALALLERNMIHMTGVRERSAADLMVEECADDDD